MVAKIKTNHSLSRTLNYNEHKVKNNKAVCLMASGYPKEHDALTFDQKLNRLTKLAALNDNVKRNSLHISLNFDPAEKIVDDTLKAIAEKYMEGIGFGNQPYLVYRHDDAGHPHIHLVSVVIDRNGDRMEMQNIGKEKSEPTRKGIEKKFGLIQADAKQRQAIAWELKAIRPAVYGKSETRRAIANVLGHVLTQYKYTSLPELNAVLNAYNVMAARGKENSRTYQNNGLLYHIIDESRKPIGVPIKASLLHNSPTLAFLEQQFKESETSRNTYKKRIKNAIELFFVRKPKGNLQELIKALGKEQIEVVLRQNKDGFIYGITFVDRSSKAVFNGRDIGTQYSAKAIQERCNTSITPRERQAEGLNMEPAAKKPKQQESSNKDRQQPDPTGVSGFILTKGATEPVKENDVGLMDILMRQERQDIIDPNLKKKQKKKRKGYRL